MFYFASVFVQWWKSFDMGLQTAESHQVVCKLRLASEEEKIHVASNNKVSLLYILFYFLPAQSVCWCCHEKKKTKTREFPGSFCVASVEWLICSASFSIVSTFVQQRKLQGFPFRNVVDFCRCLQIDHLMLVRHNALLRQHLLSKVIEPKNCSMGPTWVNIALNKIAFKMIHSKYRTQADHRRVRFSLHDDHQN